MMNSKSYKDTLNLPQTDFPMRANLPVREKEILAGWEKGALYTRIREKSRGQKRFLLHDGPPFANGDIHLGHVLNKVLKDIVVRYKTMAGFDAPFMPGWDCHGLPIEHKVAQELGKDAGDPVAIRKRSEATARRYIDIQREQFKRLGVSADWERPYLTLDKAYEAEVLRTFAELFEKGRVYEGLRPVYWSTGCRTALAEAEVEYQDREDASIYVKFPIIGESDTGKIFSGKQPALVVWTTTPWTIPANLAAAVHPELIYALVEAGSEEWVVHVSLTEGERAKRIQDLFGRPLRIRRTLKGRELLGLRYRHPLLDRESPVIDADFVTEESGTGFVHIAPGHGHDDYVAGQKHGLDVLSPVDDRGCFTAGSGVPELTGKYVFKANPAITALLKKRGFLIAEEKIRHSYPHCWRSKTPIVFRSVKQWFIRVDAFRDRALKSIDTVRWIPDWGQRRIRAGVENRHDWCISRQRAWGIPIPVFYDKENRPVLNADQIRAFAAWVQKEGTDAWFNRTDKDVAARLGLKEGLRKGRDTLDVWIDSGSSFAAVVEKEFQYPSDLYLEGSDQHRGWFQSSLLLACAAGKPAPFRSVLTHGFVVDAAGRKMSKSLGNVVAPQDVLKTMGADILRLWVVSSGYTEDVRVSKDIFARISDSYRKFRNTFKYLLGNLHGFDPDRDRLAEDRMHEMDRWALSKLAGLVEESTRAFEAYQYHRFYQLIYNFCVREMSSFYFDVLKDRLYVDPRASVSGRSCRTALFEILTTLCRLLAPVLVYTCDEAWMRLKAGRDHAFSVHLADWPHTDVRRRDAALEERWERFIAIRETVLKRLEEKREKKEIGNSLEAEVELCLSVAGDFEFFKSETPILESVFLVSRVRVRSGDQAESVSVRRARGRKCARCWKFLDEVGQNAEHPSLCVRCVDALKGLAV